MDEKIKNIKSKVERNIPFNFEDEEFLAKLIKKNKDETARELLILGNLHLAKSVAIKMAGKIKMPFADILQCARLGLIDAADKYDYSKGRFQTYAEVRIRGEIFDSVRNLCRFQYRTFKKMQKISEIVVATIEKTGCEPTIDELAAKTGYDAKFIKWTLCFLDDDFSIKQSADFNGTINVEEILESTNGNFLDGETKVLLKEELSEKSAMIDSMLAVLPERPKQIIYAVYGLDDSCVKKTQKEAGEKIGLTESTISINLKNGFQKLERIFKMNRKNIENLFKQICDIYWILQKGG